MVKKKSEKTSQPEINIGTVGHVDHGKTTLLYKLSGKWSDTHSEELKRGITIRLGYSDAIFYQCAKCEGSESYSTVKICPAHKVECSVLRKVSFVDAPGHETLMATMLSGAAVMDGVLLLIAANEECPQPQTKEHLMALEMIGIKNIIIVQNKIDLVSKEQALENYRQIKEFVKGTIAENAMIIPLSAQHNVNINLLIEAIEKNFKTPERDISKPPLMLVVRSFDINRPGIDIEDLNGGVLGGMLKQGILKVNDEIEIKPGRKVEKGGKSQWLPIITKIAGLKAGGSSLDEVHPGGSIGLLTSLDPSIVKSDSLSGNVVGHKDKLPLVWESFELKPSLLERVVGSKKELKVEQIKKGEMLMLNVNSTATAGNVVELKKDNIKVNLRLPVCCNKEDKITISRKIENRFRLIGVANIV